MIDDLGPDDEPYGEPDPLPWPDTLFWIAVCIGSLIWMCL